MEVGTEIGGVQRGSEDQKSKHQREHRRIKSFSSVPVTNKQSNDLFGT
jgi:hypothetical protein